MLTTLIVFNSLHAQHYNFINYSTESGLAQSQVRSIAQDKNGYLWLGTLAGLTKYDGKKFVNYSIQNGLIDNQIFSLLADTSNGLWIGTMGGLNHFNGKDFKSYFFKEGMAENLVTAIASDNKGNLWLATDGSGVCKFNGTTFEYFTDENGVANNYVRAACTDNKGFIWFGTKSGICFYDGKSFKTLGQNILQPQNVSHIFIDKHKNLWFSTFGEGVYCYDGKTFKNYSEGDGLINNWIRSAIEDSEGNIWFASKFGLSRFDGKTFTRFTETDGLPLDKTNIVFEDKEKNIWIGSDGKGLCKFLGETFTYLTTKDGLSSNLVLSVLEDQNQNLWFSTFDKGITKKEKNKVTVYSTNEGLNNNTIWASLKDKKNNLWFCTSDGISSYNGKTFKNYGINEGLSARKIFSICQDHSGNLWFGTTQGVAVFDGAAFKNYVSDSVNIGRDVMSIVEDKKNRLWFATKNGLYKFENNRFTKYTTSDGLCNNNLLSLVEDKDTNLWIGTRAGINYYDGKTFSRILIEGIFNSNNVCFLELDKNQSLWIGTNSGIFVLDAKEYLKSRKAKFRHYTIFDGLPGMECNQNAAYRDHVGNIWMGTTEGVIKYDPNIKDFRSDNIEPITHISGVRLFLRDTNWTKITSEIDQATLLPKNLQVKYQTSHFTFDYIGVKLSNPTSVRYKYKLEGFDDYWSAETEATFATYSNLPHGKYIFKVIAGDVMGSWNKTPATFNFEILPPFWTKWWFILLCILAGLLLLFGIYKYSINEIRKKHQTQQLEYKSKLMLLEHQSLNSSMNRHFIFNALNSIQYYMDKEDKLSANRYLSRFAKLIRMNLDSSMSNLVPVSEEISRLDLYLQIELMRFEDKFQYNISIADDIDVESIEIPPMLLQPYVENSILHGILPSDKTGRIDIRVEQGSDERIIFSIQDNGIGIEESKARKMSKRSLHVSRGTSITTQRIQLLAVTNHINISINGPFELKDTENNVLGTRVELII
ncbi:two-component regulator propeller domain-containing protein [Aurantibacillus circumpalustris]|uniref:two-component regulator propeller domain-containing protein n=1 Tax=Aurantibacillus circumpalustris TaxID=3036359 RepID=UPI00295BCE4E|nr:two-component regulator propeller domain-containing protein [Aurantibacillus circumpalustris]